MNQSKGHWLLSDVLTIAITITIKMQIALLQLFNGPEMFDLFEVKILLLHNNTQVEVIKVFKPFLEFLRSFDAR
jgi:hypothetical protein